MSLDNATPEEILEAKKVAVQIRNMLASYDPAADSLFAAVGPSEEFLNTRLNEAGVTDEQLKQVIGKIDAAVESDDLNTLNNVLKVGETILKGVVDIIL